MINLPNSALFLLLLFSLNKQREKVQKRIDCNNKSIMNFEQQQNAPQFHLALWMMASAEKKIIYRGSGVRTETHNEEIIHEKTKSIHKHFSTMIWSLFVCVRACTSKLTTYCYCCFCRVVLDLKLHHDLYDWEFKLHSTVSHKLLRQQ